MISIIIDSMIRVSGLAPDAARALAERWSIDNPAYVEAVTAKPPRYTGPTRANPGGIPKRLAAGECWGPSILYGRDEVTYVALYRALLPEVLALYPGAAVEDRRATLPAVGEPPALGFELREYQAEAVAKLTAREDGVLVAPTGAGKTKTFLGVIHALRQRTLVLAHTNALCEQWRQVVAADLGAWGEANVTVATVQSLAGNKSREAKELPAHGLVIVDEVHHLGSAQHTSVLSRSTARYRYGCTATPKRADGKTPLVTWQIGPVVAKVEHAGLIEAGNLVEPEIKTVHTGCRPIALRRTGRKSVVMCCEEDRDLMRVIGRAETLWREGFTVSVEFGRKCKTAIEGFRSWPAGGFASILDAKGKGYESPGTLSFSDLIDQLISDHARNMLIVSIIARDVAEGHTVLCLTQRVEHAEALAALLEAAGVASHVVVGKVGGKERTARLEDVRTGKVPVLLASQVADEGLDLPRISRVVLATPQKSQNATVQRVGRAMRPMEGKGRPRIWDLIDDFGLFKWSQARSRAEAFERAAGRGKEDDEEELREGRLGL